MNRQSEIWLFKQIESIYMHFIGAKNTIIGIITTRIFIASLLLLGAFAIYFTGYLIEHNNPASLSTVMNDFYINLSSELVGIVITVLLIDTFSAIRQIRNEKESLALQVCSPNNMFAVEAIRIMKSRGWHRDGTLWYKNLHNANLANTDLTEFDFRKSILSGADMSGSNLSATNFDGCDLRLVNFKNANLIGCAFKGTDMSDANLEGVTWLEVHMDEDTILPDGTKWSYSADTMRFVDSNHPEFWQSNNPKSPAFES